jgi:molybdopterin molybdotransferase
MTGAPVPPGADAVVRVEDTDGGHEAVAIVVPVDAGTNVRYRGEVLARGALALDAGAPLGPAQLGLLASCGRAEVAVHRRPRVAILSSGDELVELDRFDEVLAGRRVAASNGYALHAAVRAAGGEPVLLGIAGDTPEAVRAGLERAAGCDLALTSGGMSVGAFDYVRAVVASMAAPGDPDAGGEFWRVRMRPGAPVGFGRLGSVGNVPWVGLPGNPVSALVTFELFARPALRRMLGHRRVFRRPVPVTLAEPVTTGARLTHFLRAVVEPGDDGGRLVARLTGPQGSHDATSTARANALLVVPEDARRLEAGEVVRALLLSEEAQLAEECAL